MVLDRPNPIGGVAVQGPLRDPEKDASFVGYHAIAVRHGMTVGELAKMMNEERGWKNPAASRRSEELEPGGNLRQDRPGLGTPIAEHAFVDGGFALPRRRPHRNDQHQRRPWDRTPVRMDRRPLRRCVKLAQELVKAKLPGIAFVPTSITPTASKFAKENCGGVAIIVTDWNAVDPLKTGITLMTALRKL